MSFESSQAGGEQPAEKARDASEKAKESFDSVVQNVGRSIREGFADAKDAFANTKDAVNERLHRGAAEAEHTRRDVAGDEMTPVEHLTSLANEAKNDAQAGIDAAKQNLRKG